MRESNLELMRGRSLATALLSLALSVAIACLANTGLVNIPQERRSPLR